MRPVRFVALSEDGGSFVLADEVGRLLALPIDARLSGVLRPDRAPGTAPMASPASDAEASLSPRDIQARIRSGRDALLASLDRPLSPDGGGAAPGELSRPSNRPVAGGAAALLGGSPARPGSAFDDDPDAPKEAPAVPSLAVLRPRRTGAGPETSGVAEKPARKRLPSWDDVLFGSAPARESS